LKAELLDPEIVILARRTAENVKNNTIKPLPGGAAKGMIG
jgi:hypothetical protein